MKSMKKDWYKKAWTMDIQNFCPKCKENFIINV